MVIAEAGSEEIDLQALSPVSAASDSSSVSWKIKPMVHYWEKRMRRIRQGVSCETPNRTRRVPIRERSNKSISEIMDLLIAQDSEPRPADRRDAILTSCLSLTKVEDIVCKLERQSSLKQ